MQSWLEGRIWVGKGAQAQGWLQSLRILSSKADSNTCESFTRSGLKLGVSASRVTTLRRLQERATKPLLTRDNDQKHLTWAVEKKNSVVQVLFSDESKFCILFGNQGPRVWRKSGEAQNHVAWSPVWSFHSQWWFGLPCHLLVLSPQSTQPSTRNFRALPCFLLLTSFMGDADFIFPAGLGTCPPAKGTKAGSMTMVYCAWLASQTRLTEPYGESMGYCQEEDERHQTQQCRWAEGHCQETWASYPSAVPQLITSMPRQIEAVIKAKESPYQVVVHIQ